VLFGRILHLSNCRSVGRKLMHHPNFLFFNRFAVILLRSVESVELLIG
jgi:hypothetical protein